MKLFIKKLLREAISKQDRVNIILDKISDSGMDSLSKLEKSFLQQTTDNNYNDDIEKLLDINSGSKFKGDLNGIDAEYTYEETYQDEDYSIEHVGELELNNGGEISHFHIRLFYNIEGEGEFSFNAHDGDDYFEFNAEFEELLESFFKEIGDKINKTL